MNKKPKTIAQFCILKWLDANFDMAGMTVEFLDADSAAIKDESGMSAQVIYNDGYIHLA